MADPERFERARQIVSHAHGLSDAEQRAYLDRACAGDAALRQEVESLLAHDRGSAHLLDAAGVPSLVGDLMEGTDVGTPRTHPDSIGPFKITGLLGEGGMGTVYDAEQQDPPRPVVKPVVRS